MGRITAYEAEKKYKISRMTVGRWIKAGRIVADISNEVDETELLDLVESKRPHSMGDDPPKQTCQRRNASPSKPHPTDPDPDIVVPPAARETLSGPPVVPRSDLTSGDHLRPGSDLAVQDKQVTVSTKQVKLAREKIRYLADVKKLIPYDAVGRSYAMISSTLEEQFRMFDEREGEELFALAKDSTVIDFKKIIKQKIDHSVRSVCAVVEKQNAELQEAK